MLDYLDRSRVLSICFIELREMVNFFRKHQIGRCQNSLRQLVFFHQMRRWEEQIERD